MKPAHYIEAKLKNLEQLCRSEGIALTVQRRFIFQALAGRSDHPTADMIYDDVKTSIEGISRTTVYRVLDTLVRLGMAVKVSNPEAKARFDADTSVHHHLICLNCGRVADYPADDLVIPKLSADNFTILKVSLSITGFCAGCNTSTVI